MLHFLHDNFDQVLEKRWFDVLGSSCVCQYVCSCLRCVLFLASSLTRVLSTPQTTILYKLKLGEVVTTIPTIGT